MGKRNQGVWCPGRWETVDQGGQERYFHKEHDSAVAGSSASEGPRRRIWQHDIFLTLTRARSVQ